MGGFRVGVVKDITPTRHDRERPAARRSRSSTSKLDKKVEPLGRGHEAARAAALGARPQVRRAPARDEQADVHVRRHGSRSRTRPSRSSSRTCSRPSTRRRARTSRTPPPASATPSPAAAQSINRAIEALNPFFRALTPVMTNLANPTTRARPVLPPDRPRLGAGRAGGAHPGAPVHRHGGHVRGHLGRPARAPGHDREGGADDGRLDPVLPRAAAVLRGLHRPLAPAAPRRRRARRARCRRSTAHFKVGTPILPKTVELNDNLEDALQRRQRPVREPEHAARAARHRHRADREPPGDRVHRALPDGLQLPQLLHRPAGRGAVSRPVGPDRRRHLAEPEHEDAELEPGEQLRHLDRLAALGHPGRA